jgi:hypothetical protein
MICVLYLILGIILLTDFIGIYDFNFRGVTIIYLDGQRDTGTPYCDQKLPDRESNGSNDSNETEFDSNGQSASLVNSSPTSTASSGSPSGLKKGKLGSVIRESLLFSFSKKRGMPASGKSQENLVPTTVSSHTRLPRPLSEDDLSKIKVEPINVIRIFAGLCFELILYRERGFKSYIQDCRGY